MTGGTWYVVSLGMKVVDTHAPVDYKALNCLRSAWLENKS